MERETRLWLVRHAPVAGPAGTIHDPDAAADLSDTRRLNRLRDTLPIQALAVCSPARRTRETASTLGLNPKAEPAFGEQAFGQWTNRRHSELAEKFGEIYNAFWRSPASNRPPGGESFVDQIARVETGLAALPSGDVILIVHSGTIRAILAIALSLAPDRALSFVLDTLSLTRIDRLEGGWRIVAVNRTL